MRAADGGCGSGMYVFPAHDVSVVPVVLLALGGRSSVFRLTVPGLSFFPLVLAVSQPLCLVSAEQPAGDGGHGPGNGGDQAERVALR